MPSSRIPNPGDEDRPGSSQTAENVCRKCKGSGRIDGDECPDCGGTGFIVEIVGDA